MAVSAAADGRRGQGPGAAAARKAEGGRRRVLPPTILPALVTNWPVRTGGGGGGVAVVGAGGKDGLELAGVRWRSHNPDR